MLRSLIVAAVLLVIAAPPAIARASDRFELRDGDKVVMLGGAIIEQEQIYGDWETLLTAAYPDRNVTFRNLGWSGDTVWGESRGMFEPHLGYERLTQHVQHEQPTVVIIGYGNNEAFGGEQRLEAFEAQLNKLITDLSAKDRRFVFLSPLLMEVSQLPVQSDAANRLAKTYNRDVVHYADIIRRVADERGSPYIDLQASQVSGDDAGSPPLTDNGQRLTAEGYRRTARWIASHLIPGGNVDRLEAVVDLDFDTPAAVALRDVIKEKNQLYFHRWRPQNFTYLFGFRKHEQGNNAVEIPQFDPLIAAAEEKIAELRTAIQPGDGNS